MWKAAFKLENAKQKKPLWLYLSGTIFLCLVLSGRPEILFGVICFLAIVFGAATALPLRRQSERDLETLLPASPPQRVFAAYLVGGRNLLLAIGFPLALCFWQLALPWPSSLGFRIFFLSLIVAHLHLLS